MIKINFAMRLIRHNTLEYSGGYLGLLMGRTSAQMKHTSSRRAHPLMFIMRRVQRDAARHLTLRGRVTHICFSKLTIISSDNGLSPGRRQALIWPNAEILLIRPLGTNFSEISIEFHTFSFKKMHLKMSSGKCRPSCLGLNVLTLSD